MLTDSPPPEAVVGGFLLSFIKCDRIQQENVIEYNGLINRNFEERH